MEKSVDNEKRLKARLYARGFKRQQRQPNMFQKRLSPHLLNLKITLFQGKIIEHTVFARSSEESKTKKVGKLRNCVYKLADASRLCYLKLKKELIRLRATSSILDKGILAWTKEQIFIFIVSCLVDDVFWTGNQEFRYIIK